LARWNIETTIIVPGAFTSGTNHFAYAGSPEDKARLKEYESRQTANLGKEIMKGFELTEAADADVSEVAKAIVKVVDMPFGTRPFRVHIDPAKDGAEIVNGVADLSVRNCYGTCNSQITHFNEQELTALLFTLTTINAWNRLAITMVPKWATINQRRPRSPTPLKIRGGPPPLDNFLYRNMLVKTSPESLPDRRQYTRNTAQRHLSDRGPTQTHFFVSECDWSISLIARLSRA
jgi:hypothetical protein